jgi:hypothetical protein
LGYVGGVGARVASGGILTLSLGVYGFVIKKNPHYLRGDDFGEARVQMAMPEIILYLVFTDLDSYK